MRRRDGLPLTLQQRFLASKDDDVLCCCEYINDQGEKSHILACCCDCEAVDLAADRIITCRAMPSGLCDRLIDTAVDRCRIPACFGQGACRVKLDVILPVILVPLSLLLATLGPLMSVFVLIAVPTFIAVFHAVWRRRFKTFRTKFFLSWVMTSAFCIFYVFESVIFSFREILLWENMTCVTLGGIMFYFMYICKYSAHRLNELASRGRSESQINKSRKFHSVMYSGEDGEEIMKVTVEDENKLPSRKEDDLYKPAASQQVLSANSQKIVDSRPIKDGKLVTWCDVCEQERRPRSGHCTICNICIDGRDHHCIWLDCCIGDHNHRSFVMTMMTCAVLGVYGCHISLTSICTPEMIGNWFLVPSDCRFLYSDIWFASSFVTVVYTAIGTALILVGIFVQFVMISQNVTQQELHQARNRRFVSFCCYAQNNANNFGFVRNWRLFWTGRRSLAGYHVV